MLNWSGGTGAVYDISSGENRKILINERMERRRANSHHYFDFTAIGAMGAY
jgi:hypothetical protein